MKLLEIPAAVSERVHYLLQPIIADVRWPDRSKLTEADQQNWERLTNVQLEEWEDNPRQLADEDREPPAPEVFPLVAEVIVALRDHGIEPPLRVVPNGEGGVVFEWRDNPYYWSLEVEKAGSLALAVFRHGRLVSRHQLP